MDIYVANFCGNFVKEIVDGVSNPNNTLELFPFLVDFSILSQPIRPFFGCDPTIISEMVTNDEDIRLFQIQTEKQRDGLACGYNSLYNGQLVYNQVTAQQPESKKLIYNKYLYWHFAVAVNKLLLKEQEKYCKSSFPWSRENILSFVMERSYMNFVIKNCAYFISVPDISKKLLENCFLPARDILKIQEKFEKFKEGGNKICVFCLGSLNHWFPVVLNRIDEKVEAIVADSRNAKYFGFSDFEERKKYVRERINMHYKSFEQTPELLKKNKEREVRYAALSLEGVETVKLVVDCCTGKRNFIVEAIEGGIQGVFKQFVFAKNDIFIFMEKFGDPSVMKFGLLKLMKEFKKYLKYVGNLKVFREWIDFVMKNMESSENKLTGKEYNSPKVSSLSGANAEEIWKRLIVEKENTQKEELFCSPLLKDDIKNRDNMIPVLIEFRKIIDSCNNTIDEN